MVFDRTKEYSYDRFGQLVQTEITGTETDTICYQYDAVGNRTHLEKDGEDTSYSYNSLHQLTNSVTEENGSVTHQKSYGYDDNGNQIRETDHADGSDIIFEYDGINQLSKVTVSEGTDTIVQENLYNGNGQYIKCRIIDLDTSVNDDILFEIDNEHIGDIEDEIVGEEPQEIDDEELLLEDYDVVIDGTEERTFIDASQDDGETEENGDAFVSTQDLSDDYQEWLSNRTGTSTWKYDNKVKTTLKHKRNKLVVKYNTTLKSVEVYVQGELVKRSKKYTLKKIYRPKYKPGTSLKKKYKRKTIRYAAKILGIAEKYIGHTGGVWRVAAPNGTHFKNRFDPSKGKIVKVKCRIYYSDNPKLSNDMTDVYETLKSAGKTIEQARIIIGRAIDTCNSQHASYSSSWVEKFYK